MGIREEESWEELGLVTVRNASSEGNLGLGERAGVVCLYPCVSHSSSKGKSPYLPYGQKP